MAVGGIELLPLIEGCNAMARYVGVKYIVEKLLGLARIQ